jgi:hypothetical protein
VNTTPILPIGVECRRLAARFRRFLIGLALLSVCPVGAFAQVDQSHTATTQQQELTPEQRTKASALIRIVRESTERFKDVAAAKAEGYVLQFGCVSGSDYGAMGLHYVNGALVMAGEIDATRPQIVIYEPAPDGTQHLIGADYLILADAWNATHSSPPELMGQLFHLSNSPNRFGLPAFYTLHVWAWKENPSGAFVNSRPNVSCESFI